MKDGDYTSEYILPYMIIYDKQSKQNLKIWNEIWLNNIILNYKLCLSIFESTVLRTSKIVDVLFAKIYQAYGTV